jgi:hypothetical protein
MCLGALETALGVAAARRVARRAEAKVALHGLDPVDAVAAALDEELRKVRGMDCPERGGSRQGPWRPLPPWICT